MLQAVFCILLMTMQAVAQPPSSPEPTEELSWQRMTDDIYPQPDDPGTRETGSFREIFASLAAGLSSQDAFAIGMFVGEERARWRMVCAKDYALIASPPALTEPEQTSTKNGPMTARVLTYWIRACGYMTSVHAAMLQLADFPPRVLRLMPGFTTADWRLQLDMAMPARVLAGSLKDKACDETPIGYFSAVHSYARRAVDGNAGSDMHLLETWSFGACGRNIVLRVYLHPSPEGGTTFSLSPHE